MSEQHFEIDPSTREEGLLLASLKGAEEEEGRGVQARACARTNSLFAPALQSSFAVRKAAAADADADAELLASCFGRPSARPRQRAGVRKAEADWSTPQPVGAHRRATRLVRYAEQDRLLIG